MCGRRLNVVVGQKICVYTRVVFLRVCNVCTCVCMLVCMLVRCLINLLIH